MWGISCPLVHPYLGPACVSLLFPSSLVLRKADKYLYTLCLQCVSLMVKIPVRYVAASVFTIALLNFAQSSPFLTMSRFFEIVFFSVACL